MFLRVPLKSSLILRISKIHLLKHLFLLWTKCFRHTKKLHSSRTLSLGITYKLSHLLPFQRKHQITLIFDMMPVTLLNVVSQITSCSTSQYLKTTFWWIWFLFVPTKKTFFLSLSSNCKLETYRNANLQKKGSTKPPCKAIHSRHSPTA